MKNKNFSKRPSLKNIEKELIGAGIEISRKGEGALFIITNKLKYRKMINQKIEEFSIFGEGARKLLVSIGMIDGAVIINHNGIVVDYGVKVGSKRVLKGFGTRHAAAYSASFYKSTVAILISQEERKIKVFSKGKIVAKIDALEKGIEKKVEKAHEVLESIGVGTISSLSLTALAPSLGVAVVPGILLFGIPYYVFRKIYR